MIRVVIDTNVIVSATRSSNGTPWEIMGLVFMGELQLYLNNTILDEYGATLAKEKLGISKKSKRRSWQTLEKLVYKLTQKQAA